MYKELFIQVLIAAVAVVGVMEFIKNFIPVKPVLYAVFTLALSTFAFFAIVYLPVWVIGSLLTLGCVQMGYEIFIQGVREILRGVARYLSQPKNYIADPNSPKGEYEAPPSIISTAQQELSFKS